MQDSAKYLIHAEIRASGVVERSDVVGAIFGQTEGLLGNELDLRTLQDASKVGRIDVEIESDAGRSYGTVTIASGLDKAETAVLAAALETIDRVGPCRAEFEVTDLEDARAAKRREVVDRATDLLAAFEETALSSRELVEEVRQNIRVEDIGEYEGLPAGPRVTDSDAIIVVEGRADVLTLLRYGIKNAVAVEGTDVPEAVAELTRDRTVTTFLDGDRGGDLILRELDQVGSVDYVTFAPAGKSVEDLSRDEVLSALRKKAPYDQLTGPGSIRDAFAGETQPAERPADPTDDASTAAATSHDGSDAVTGDAADELAAQAEAVVEAAAGEAEPPDGQDASPDATATGAADTPEAAAVSATAESTAAETGAETAEVDAEATETTAEAEVAEDDETHDEVTDDEDDADDSPPTNLAGHVDAVVDSGQVRLLDDEWAVLAEAPADDAFDAIEAADAVPATVVLDGDLSQRVLDVAAQRGVPEVVATGTGEFVKQPTSVRVRLTAEV
ncbi:MULTISPECIES: DNA primase DnaG [Salinibaculum]|uniref:DNA primase DnaG n=1 Tax=Salinibaculum TaxID=2732368 RepID=UPI0030D0AD09